MQPIVVVARKRPTTLVVVAGKIEAARTKLRYWPEEAGEGNPACIHVEVIGEFPKEFCLYSDRRSGDDPFPVRIVAGECRSDSLDQPGMGFRRRRFQLRSSRGVGLEFLALLDAERKEHAKHLEITRLHWLLVDHSRETVVKAVVIGHDGVIEYAGHVYETRLLRVAGLAQRVDPDPLHQRVARAHIRFGPARQDGADQHVAAKGLGPQRNVAGRHLALVVGGQNQVFAAFAAYAYVGEWHLPRIHDGAEELGASVGRR